MRNSTVIGRAAAVAAVLIAVIAVALILLSGGSSYQVKAVFQDASQLVRGDQVEVAGNSVGSISGISLTPNGQAQVTLSINNSTYSPLHQGTLATVRQASLSGIANRYVDLRLGAATAPKIPNNGVLPTTNTTSAVDVDQLFNTLTPQTRKGLQDVIQGSAAQFAGKGQQAQAAWVYLNPSIAATSMLFRELNRNTAKFTAFLVNTSHLVTDIASRQQDLSNLVTNLSQTTSALAAAQNQDHGVSESIRRLPGFMALADTTFVNLRNTLDALTPLVNESKPVAPKLQRLLEQLKPLAINSVPTVRALSNTIRKPGADNDLIELTELGRPLREATCGGGPGADNCQGTVFANGRHRLAAFPESTKALNKSTPELGTARPYAVDLTGWFEGYSHPGGYDANGGYSRVAPVIGVGSLQSGSLNLLPNLLTNAFNRLPFAQSILTTGQGDRCPGSMERGALWYPQSGYPCNPSEQPTGP